MPVRSIKKSGSSVVGSFPSLKLERSVRFESTLEKDYLLFLEYDSTVSFYEEQPFTIYVTLNDGSPHAYTPDFKVIQNDLRIIVEIKPFEFLGHEHTKRQIEAGRKWAPQNDHLFQVVTNREIRNGPMLGNLKLMYRYSRLSNYPFDLFQELNKLFPRTDIQIPFGVVAGTLMPSNPSRCKPYLWSLLFHHFLDTDLNQRLSDLSPISLSQKGVNVVQNQN
jgi:hypothetical protein